MTNLYCQVRPQDVHLSVAGWLFGTLDNCIGASRGPIRGHDIKVKRNSSMHGKLAVYTYLFIHGESTVNLGWFMIGS